MIIYKDKISGDEMFSDTYKITEEHGVVYKVLGKLVTLTDAEADIGGNPSAEGGDDEGVDASSVSGVNVVLAHRLFETSFKKKDYMTYIKGFMKAIKKDLEENNPGEVEVFTKGAQDFVKQVIGEFDEYQFFMGESCNAEGVVALMKWNEEEAILYFFKHAIEAEKV